MKTKQKPKPRLSIKLLWKIAAEYRTLKEDEKHDNVFEFLAFLEEQMKPLKP